MTVVSDNSPRQTIYTKFRKVIAARVDTETVQIDGHTVREGSAVFLLVGGANRDPAIDTTRGIHVCLGGQYRIGQPVNRVVGAQCD